MKETEKFTVWQLTALAHPHNGEDAPNPACIHGYPGKRSVILTCDIDDESCESFGGPLWHVSVFPSVRAKAQALLAKIGEGEPFEEPGVIPQIFHLRKRMTAAEIEQMGDSVQPKKISVGGLEVGVVGKRGGGGFQGEGRGFFWSGANCATVEIARAAIRSRSARQSVCASAHADPGA